MYDVEQLENQWKAYKRKKRLRPLAFVVGAVGVISLGYFAWPWVKQYIETHTNVSGEDKTHASVPTPLTQASERGWAPTPASTNASSGARKNWKISFGDTAASGNTSDVPEAMRRLDIEVATRKSDVSAHEIEKRFRFAKDKDDALFLARYYYDKKAYKKALNWALETNKLDSDIEESWLIFGRAKARLGQRTEAIRVLQAYYDRTGSPKAQKLLDAIRRGKTP